MFRILAVGILCFAAAIPAIGTQTQAFEAKANNTQGQFGISINAKGTFLDQTSISSEFLDADSGDRRRRSAARGAVKVKIRRAPSRDSPSPERGVPFSEGGFIGCNHGSNIGSGAVCQEAKGKERVVYGQTCTFKCKGKPKDTEKNVTEVVTKWTCECKRLRQRDECVFVNEKGEKKTNVCGSDPIVIRGACFPASARVTMADFTRRPITKLFPGSRLAYAFLGGQVSDTAFMGDMHERYPGHTDVSLDFVQIVHAQMTNNLPLRLTPNHLLPIARNRGTWRLMPAFAVRAGDQVLAEAPEGKSMMPSTITETKLVTGKGMFAPLTSSGSLLVDGVSVSSFALTNQQQQSLWETSPWFRDHVSSIWSILVLPTRILYSFGLPYMWMHDSSVHSVVDRVLNVMLQV